MSDTETYYTGSGIISVTMPSEAVDDCSHQGACDDDVAFWIDSGDVTFSEQFKTDEGTYKHRDATPAAIAAELSEYGAWDEEELSDHEQNLHRLLWSAACSLKEERYEAAR